MVEQLLEIGFSEYEANVYLALIMGDKLAASEICNLAGVPKGRVYGVLASLMEMGMCIMIPGSVKRYQALPPDLAFSVLCEKRRLAQEAEELKTMKLSKQLSALYEEDENLDPEFDSVSIYTSPITIAKKFYEMIDKTEAIHRSLCKPPYLVIQSIDEVAPKSGSVIEALQRGVEFRTIYELEEEDVENFSYICEYFHSQGEKVRIIKKLPIKLAIMDSSIALFTMHHRYFKRNKFSCMFIENSDLIVALTDLFDYYWSIATDYTDFVKNGNKLN